MHVILADHAPHDANLERFADLANQIPQPLRHLTPQHLVTVLGHPNKVILNLVNRVAAVSIGDNTSFIRRPILVAEKLTS